MLSVKFTWLEAAIATGLVLAVAAALARRRSASPRLGVIAVSARETGMLLGLFALWTYAGSKSEVSLAEAMHRAAWIGHAEREGESTSYYERWLQAFEQLLADKGLLDAGALDERTREFESGRRDDVF